METQLKPNKIVHIVGGLGLGGLERWLVETLPFLKQWGLDIDVITFGGNNDYFYNNVKEMNFNIIHAKLSNNLFHTSRELRRIYEMHGPYTIAHSHMYYFNGLVLKSARKAGIPYRMSHIYPLIDVRKQTALRKLYKAVTKKWISKYATHTIAITKSVLEKHGKEINISDHVTEVLYPSIDLKSFYQKRDKEQIRLRYGLPADKTVVLYVARFFEHKNQRQIIRIADELERRGASVHFVLAGARGPTAEEITALAGERSNFTILFNIDDVADLMSASDIFAFPSLNEGFGIVALEACAAGLPVVATDLPSIREVIPPSHQELMFPPQDDNAFLTNLERLVKDDALRSRLSEDARTQARLFSVEETARKLYDLYSSVTEP